MSDINNHIDNLLIKYLLAEASAVERTEVEAWIAARAENKIYYQQFRAIWEQSKSLAIHSDRDVNAAWQLFQNRIHKPKPTLRIIDGFAWMRVAAVLIIVAGIALIAYRQFGATRVQQITVQSLAVVKTDTLPDHTIVTLNKQASITYPNSFDKATRSVVLKGEAFFDVTPDKTKPFIIEANSITIKVVGTSFNVRTEGDATEVIVKTGIVQVQKGEKIVLLRPSEKIMIRQGDTVLNKEQEISQLYNYYKTHAFVCDNTPLWKLVEVLNEAYHSNIVIERPELRKLPLTATFPNESLDQILSIISLTFDIQVEKANKAIILK